MTAIAIGLLLGLAGGLALRSLAKRKREEFWRLRESQEVIDNVREMRGGGR